MRQATRKDRLFVIDIISAAFNTNPSVNWVVKNDHKRKKRIRELARYSFHTALRRKGAYISSSENGIALCYRPNYRKETFPDYLSQLRLAVLSIGIFRILSVMKREQYTKTIRPRNGNYYYFWFYGVKPGMHDTGDARELMEEIFKMADHEHLPIYLETSVEKNRRVYTRYGFELYHTWYVKAKKLNLYFMRRSPRNE